MKIVLFDLETTGLNPAGGDRIVELAAVRFRDGKPIEEFATLVNPMRPISRGASRVNGLTDPMVSDAPVIEEVFKEFLDFLGPSTVGAHNASFDVGFLVAEAGRVGVSPPTNPVLCTLELARNLLPRLRSHSLANLVSALDLGMAVRHRALSDVYATAAVLDALLDRAPKKRRTSASNLLRLQGGAIPWPDVDPARVLVRIPDALQRAMEVGGFVEVEYQRADGAVTSRRIQPMSAHQRGTRTYLVAYCELRREERTFRLDRFRGIKPGR